MYTSDQIRRRIAYIVDPEIGISVADLAPAYEARRNPEGSVTIRMSLTTPACPLGPTIKQQVAETLGQDPEVSGVHFEWGSTLRGRRRWRVQMRGHAWGSGYERPERSSYALISPPSGQDPLSI